MNVHPEWNNNSIKKQVCSHPWNKPGISKGFNSIRRKTGGIVFKYYILWGLVPTMSVAKDIIVPSFGTYSILPFV